MSRCTVLFACLATLWCSTSGLSAQDASPGDDTVRLVSWLDWLRTPRHDFPVHSVGIPDGSYAFYGSSSVFTLAWAFDGSFDSEAVEEWITEDLDRRGIEIPDVDALDGAAAYLVQGSEESVDAFQQCLDTLRQVIRRQVRYRIRLLQPKDSSRFGLDGTSCLLKGDALERLLDTCRVVIDHEAVRPLGFPLQIGEVRDRLVVLDYETESASDVSIADPRCRTVFDGPRIECVASRTSRDDRLRLEVHAFDALLDHTFLRHEIEDNRSGFSETPVARRSELETSFPIGSDQVIAAMIEGPAGHGRSSLWLFEAELLDAPAPASGIDCFPISDLLVVPSLSTGAQDVLGEPYIPRSYEFYRDDEIATFDRMAWELTTELGGTRLGNFLITRGNEQRQRVLRYHQALEKHRGDLLSVRGSMMHGSGSNDALIPAETGGRFRMSRVSDSHFLVDFEVEITNAVSQPNPAFEALPEGLFFAGSFGSRLGPRVQSTLVSKSYTFGPRERLELESPKVGTIDRVDAVESPWRSFAPWTLGEWRSFRTSSTHDTDDVRIRIE